MKITHLKIGCRAIFATSVGSLYYKWKNQSTSSSLVGGVKFKFFQEDTTTLCPHSFSWKQQSLNLSTVDLLFSKMEAAFNQSNDITPHCLALKSHLEKEKNLEENEYVARKMILFLRRRVFSDSIDNVISFFFYQIHPVSVTYSELEKEKLLKLECFFYFMNDLVCNIEDTKLIEEIKVLFANLPYKGDREEVSNLFLDNKEQVAILVKALQKQEDALVEKILDALKRDSIFFTLREEKLIKKLVFPEGIKEPFSLKAELSDINRERLQNALEDRQRQKAEGIKAIFANLFQRCDAWERQEFSILPEGSAKLLQRVLKCKFYFNQQLSLPSQEITIPYWYHATKRREISSIIQSREIKVFYRKGSEPGYTGAWVSSEVESCLFGRNVVAFTKKIEVLDEDVKKSLFFSSKRWRGLMKPLPLENAVFFSVRQDQNKEIQKQEKIKLYQELSLSIPSNSHYKIISERQMVFMQKEINSILGHPNLNDRLWGYIDK